MIVTFNTLSKTIYGRSPFALSLSKGSWHALGSPIILSLSKDTLGPNGPQPLLL